MNIIPAVRGEIVRLIRRLMTECEVKHTNLLLVRYIMLELQSSLKYT